MGASATRAFSPLQCVQGDFKLIHDAFQNEEYELCLHVPESRSLVDASLTCGPVLQRLLRDQEHLLRKRLEGASSAKEFLVELADLVEKLSAGKRASAPPPPPFYSRLVEELDALGLDRLVQLDASLTSLTLRVFDSAKREHQIGVRLPPTYPQAAPVLTVDLPEAFTMQWTAQSSLKCVLVDFTKAIERYQEVWTILEDLDKHTRVLEPERPNRAALFRKLALPIQHAFVQVTVLPVLARMVPQLRWYGNESVIAPLREKLNKSLATWDEHAMLRSNLERLLEITFPSPRVAWKEDEEMCIICYVYRHPLNGYVPDVVCSNTKCSRPMHHDCLIMWLKSLSDSRYSFNSIFGKCPLCSTSISVKIS